MEVEAYIGEDDRASHARFGRTSRNAVMYGPPGIAYVYLVYGMYDCLNIVTEGVGAPAAVLVRAVEPVDGLAAMREARVAWRRSRRRSAPAEADVNKAERDRLEGIPDAELARGPGLAAAAFGIDRTLTGTDMLDPNSSLHLERAAAGEAAPTVVATPRIGIGYAAAPWTDVAWRFIDPDSVSVSGPRGDSRRRSRQPTGR